MELFRSKGKAPSAAQITQEGSSALPGGLTILKLQSIAMLLVSLVVLGSAYATYLLYAQQVEEKQVLQQRVIATQVAATLQSRLTQIQTITTQLTSHPNIIEQLQAVPAGEISVPEPLIEQLRLALPQLTRGLLIDAEHQQPTTAVTPPLGYACIDLARSNTGLIELHQYGSKAQHIDITVSIPAPGEGQRQLILTFEPDMLSEWVQQLAPAGNYLELHQQTPGAKPLTIASAGNAALKSTPHQSESTPVLGNSLVLQLRHDHSITTSEKQRLIYLSGFVAELVLIPSILLLMGLLLRAVMRRDMDTLVEQIKNFGGPRQHMTAPIKMQIFRRAMAKLEQHLTTYKEEDPGKKSTTREKDDSSTPPGPPPLPKVEISEEVAPAPPKSSPDSDSK